MRENPDDRDDGECGHDFHAGKVERLTVGADVAEFERFANRKMSIFRISKFLIAANRFAAQDSEWKFRARSHNKLAARLLSCGSTCFIQESGMLIDLFDPEFIEPQEALGVRIINQFCERVSALLCESEFPKFLTTRDNPGQIRG